jgi:Ni/Co efflux regulator RcnB
MYKAFLKFFVSAIALSIFCISIPVSAEKGGGDHKANQHRHQKEKNWNKGKNQNYRSHGMHVLPGNFDSRQRAVIHDYYGPRFQSGRCPPGLAKKHNGCMPPGQARKWGVGRPLPRNVMFYDLPPHLIRQLGMPGPGYRYVRVAADILLIAAGTGMVIDAIVDLNSM